MNRNVRLAVLRILLLTEEFSTEELAEAVSYIDGQPTDDLFRYLSRRTSSRKKSSASLMSESGSSKEGETLALQAVKSVDAEKYRILQGLEQAVREGRALRTLGEFRMFGNMLDKTFNPGKSRKEALSRLMTLLAKMDIASIRAAVARMPATGSDEVDSFRRLANQLISGQSDRPAESA